MATPGRQYKDVFQIYLYELGSNAVVLSIKDGRSWEEVLKDRKYRLLKMTWVFNRVSPRDFTQRSIDLFVRDLLGNILPEVSGAPSEYLGDKYRVENKLLEARKTLDWSYNELGLLISTKRDKQRFYDFLNSCTQCFEIALMHWDIRKRINTSNKSVSQTRISISRLKMLQDCRNRLVEKVNMFKQNSYRTFTEYSIGLFERELREHIIAAVLSVPDEVAITYLGSKVAVMVSLRMAKTKLNLALDELGKAETGRVNDKRLYTHFDNYLKGLSDALGYWDVP